MIIILYVYYIVSVGERILKIGQHLAKLWTSVGHIASDFLIHRVTIQLYGVTVRCYVVLWRMS